MNFLIDCEDERQQIQVLQKLEKEGYSWSASGRPTEFVPISRIPDAKLIITKPQITTNSSEYLEYRERKVIL